MSCLAEMERHAVRLETAAKFGLDGCVVGNSTAAAAHGLLPAKNFPTSAYLRDRINAWTNKSPTTINSLGTNTLSDALVIHDLDIYASKWKWEEFTKKYPVHKRRSVVGEYSVINPNGDTSIEIFPAFNYPFDGHTLPGEKDILASSTPHDFGGNVGILRVMDPEIILAIQGHFDRPRDRVRKEIIRRALKEKSERFTKPNPKHPVTIFSARQLVAA